MMLRDYFIGPISRGKRVSLLRGDCCRRVNWAYNSTSLVAVRVAHPVVTLGWARKTASFPKPACRRNADRSKQECRSQRGAEITNHVNLLIVGWFFTVLPVSKPKLRHERRYFQYRLVLGMILRAD